GRPACACATRQAARARFGALHADGAGRRHGRRRDARGLRRRWRRLTIAIAIAVARTAATATATATAATRTDRGRGLALPRAGVDGREPGGDRQCREPGLCRLARRAVR